MDLHGEDGSVISLAINIPVVEVISVGEDDPAESGDQVITPGGEDVQTPGGEDVVVP